MSTSTKKGVSGKFLAFLASFTMILAGVIGVAFAGPASATQANDTCNSTSWYKIDVNGTVTSGATAPAGVTVTTTGLGGQSGDWTSSVSALAVYLHAGQGQYQAPVGSGTSGSWTTTYAMSELTFCYGSTPPPPTTRTVWWCDDNEATSGTQTLEGETWTPEYNDGDVSETELTNKDCDTTTPKIWICHVPQGQEDSYLLLQVDESAWQDGTSAHSQHDGDFIATGSDDPTCVPPTVITTDNAYWCDGTTPKSATRTVTDGVPGEWTPTTPPEGYQTSAQTCTSTPPPSTPNPPTTPETPTTPVTPTVVEAAQVATPVVALPATIAKPVKKPAKATLPASVPAGVAFVPGKATLPGSVPAGEGSNGLPMWALALIALGTLGAAAAGKGLLGARK